MDSDLEEFLCVLLIQRWWRLKIHIRAVRQIVPSLREKFHFFFY